MTKCDGANYSTLPSHILHFVHSFQSSSTICALCFVRDASRQHLRTLYFREFRKWNLHHLAIYSCFYESETVFDWSLPKTLLFNSPRTERVGKMSMRSPPSKFAVTAVLTISLLSLQGALWYFRPHPTGNEPPLYRSSVVNIHGGNRKLLDVNFSLESDQQLSSDHQKLVSCYFGSNDEILVVASSYTVHWYVYLLYRVAVKQIGILRSVKAWLN